MPKHIQFLVVVVAILLALAACGSTDPTSTPVPTEPMSPPAALTGTSTPVPDQTTGGNPTQTPIPLATTVTKPVNSPTPDATSVQPPEPTFGLTPTVAPEPPPVRGSTPASPPRTAPTSTPTEVPPASMPGNEVNNPAHDFTLPGISGNTHSLKSYQGDQKVVLVFYRAFW